MPSQTLMVRRSKEKGMGGPPLDWAPCLTAPGSDADAGGRPAAMLIRISFDPRKSPKGPNQVGEWLRLSTPHQSL